MTTHWKRNSGVMATPLDEELVLLKVATRELYSLNGPGRLVWDHAEEGLDRIVGAITTVFAVSPDQALADAAATLDRLVEAKLLDVA